MEIYLPEIGAFSYGEYCHLLSAWVEIGGNSSDPDNDTYNQFTKLNLARAKRLHKTISIEAALAEKIKNLQEHYSFVILTESWCGDGAQNIPVIAEVAKLNQGKIKLEILLREENNQLMNQYLTNGARSIPKLIVTNTSRDKQEFVWGPRPAPAQELLYQWKSNKEHKNWEAFEKDLHNWYNRDKTVTLQQELYELVKLLN